MRNFKTTVAPLLIGMAMFYLAGCEYDEILPPPPPDQVSFSVDIVPIFNQSCNIAGCHSGTAGFVPDLTSANAYNSLIEGNYIDTITPDNSLLYRWMTGKEGVSMPPDGTNSFYNATVLKWIEQGALEN